MIRRSISDSTMKKNKRKQKPTYVKITFVLKEKDIPSKKGFMGYKTKEDGLKVLLKSLGITNYAYEFGQIVTEPSYKKFDGSKSLRGKYFDSVWMPRPVRLEVQKKKKVKKR